ncbi:bacteriophage abortive infection AbiH family protein [Tetragenococcus koreensis]|uniref:bacteriophage abortive infection AbiH family protein n=1 Tax=Tetragenococcus koreensis TaxID=290335 RepID=UPI001F210834|nr:bacteriophage abortive infection AbiH family protein [Tetragenococcus koreensis]MCF1627477.1 bacteriophage abortive infection AbiH family protein [Tetragenococcus koreensis]
MSNLFIIGNGFDISHGLPTSYRDFRDYLVTNYPKARYEATIVPEGKPTPDGDFYFDKDEVVGFVIYIIDQVEGEDWKDLEEALGHLDFADYFDNFAQDYDEYSDYEWKEVANNEDLANSFVIPTSKIKELFSEWINTIDLDVTYKKKDLTILFEDETQVLSFNYTKTIEQVYGIEDVCHIHGIQGEELFFGHGDKTERSEEYMQKYIGAESALSDIDKQLEKDTETALYDNQPFFAELSGKNIKKMYSYGFSFSKVDEIYLEEIFTYVDTKNIVWYFNDYDSEEKIKKYENKLKNLGFKGRFSTFHVD